MERDKVLIVDDDTKFLNLLKNTLSIFNSDYDLIAVEDGEKAIGILEKEPVSLLVTDLEMPKVDGLSLLAYINEKHPAIPCIVMTAHPKPEIISKLPKDLLSFLQKPFGLKTLAKSIEDALDRKDTGDGLKGSLRGISLANFLQLIEMERKTCLIEVRSPDRGSGFIYFENGVPYDAKFQELRGEEAAYNLIGMEDVKVRFLRPPDRRIERRIKTNLSALIMDAMRFKDESAANEGGDNDDLEDLRDIEDKLNLLGPGIEIPNEVQSDGTGEVVTTERESIPEELKESLKMAMEKHMAELRSIKGYKASAVMDFTGDILASDSVDEKIDLAIVGATFNDIFRSSHEASNKVGLDYCHDLTIETPKGVIVMVCSGVDAKVHFHLIGVVGADGNRALMKLQLDKMVPKLMAELA